MSPTYRYQRGIGMPAGLSLGPPGPLPPMVKALIVANTAAYLLQLLTPDSVLVLWFGLIPRAVIGGLELWRVATYQFLHGGVWHLALNMLVLWMFGTELEQRWGPRFFLKYYMLCAVGGGLTYTFVRAGSMMPSVGASDAIYGVLMAYGIWFPNRVVLLAFLFPIRVRHLIVFLIALELVQAMESTGAGIAYAAHLGGMAFGYGYLRWWIKGGPSLGPLPGWHDLRRAYFRWKLRRLQRKRFGPRGGGPRTLH